MTAKLTELNGLQLPTSWERRIGQIIFEHRMLYEPWIESAGSYEELRGRLKARGFTNIPRGATPILEFKAYSQAPKAETSSCEVKKTMLRKKK